MSAERPGALVDALLSLQVVVHSIPLIGMLFPQYLLRVNPLTRLGEPSRYSCQPTSNVQALEGPRHCLATRRGEGYWPGMSQEPKVKRWLITCVSEVGVPPKGL